MTVGFFVWQNRKGGIPLAKDDHKHIIVGLDIGTSKIACVVAEVSPDDRLDVIGIGTHPSSGLKRGVVVNIESTGEALRLPVE